MSNVLSYHDAWADLRKAVKAARADYLRKVERATPYLPSEKAQEDIEAARADYDAALEAARAVARPRFGRAIKSMREHIAAPDMKAPSDEQLRLLKVLDMRDSVEGAEVESAAKAMGNNDAALKALRDILMRKGAIMPANIKTFEAQQNDAVAELERAASNLLQWDGRTRDEISSDVSKAYHDYRWAGGAPVPENARAAQWVADLEAQSTYRATVQSVIGDGVSMAVVDALG